MNLVLGQSRAIILFSTFAAWALLIRKRDPEGHKRLWILATIVILPAAIDRMRFLPHTVPESPLSIHLYMLLWLTPALLVDFIRFGRPHRVYVIGMALILPFAITVHSLWGSPWWYATAPRLMNWLQ